MGESESPSSVRAAPRTTRGWFWALWAVAFSVPITFGIEILLGDILFAPQVEEVRVWLETILTPVAWGLALVSPFVNGAAVLVFRRLWKRAEDHVPASEASWKRFEGLMISASVAQLPGIAAVLIFVLGAGTTPVAVAVGLSGVGVIILGFNLKT